MTMTEVKMPGRLLEQGFCFFLGQWLDTVMKGRALPLLSVHAATKVAEKRTNEGYEPVSCELYWGKGETL